MGQDPTRLEPPIRATEEHGPRKNTGHGRTRKNTETHGPRKNTEEHGNTRATDEHGKTRILDQRVLRRGKAVPRTTRTARLRQGFGEVLRSYK